MTKTCPGCARVLDLDQFHRDRTRKDGRRAHCRECQAARKAAYRAAHAEKVRARNAAYRAANPEKVRARLAAWKAENPDKVRAGHWVSLYRSRARRYGIPVRVETFTVADVVATHGDRCHQCGGPFDELDHYPIPVRDGGAHTLANVRPSCTPCNRGRTQNRPKRPAGSEAA